MAHVRFQVLVPELAASLQTLWPALRSAKEGDWPQDAVWIPYFPPRALRAFDWPREAGTVRADWAVWLAHWGRGPEVAGLGDGSPAPELRLEHGWDVLSMLDALRSGEYAFGEYRVVEPNLHQVQLHTFAYPFGGIGALLALVEAFGGYPIHWTDGGGPVNSRVPIGGGRP